MNHRQALTNDPYKDFRQAVDRGETKIDLGRAALTIAAPDYPNLDIDAYLSRIDALATTAAARLRFGHQCLPIDCCSQPRVVSGAQVLR